MLYEYRRYEAAPGRMPDLLHRFENHTLGIWARFGIEQVAFWLADVGSNNELHYILRWADMADREKRWKAFQADEEWKRTRASTEANGPLLTRTRNEFWTRPGSPPSSSAPGIPMSSGGWPLFLGEPFTFGAGAAFVTIGLGSHPATRRSQPAAAAA